MHKTTEIMLERLRYHSEITDLEKAKEYWDLRVNHSFGSTTSGPRGNNYEI